MNIPQQMSVVIGCHTRVIFTILYRKDKLRANHTDAHWCKALYRTTREMDLIKYRETSLFISSDDKTKVDWFCAVY